MSNWPGNASTLTPPGLRTPDSGVRVSRHSNVVRASVGSPLPRFLTRESRLERPTFFIPTASSAQPLQKKAFAAKFVPPAEAGRAKVCESACDHQSASDCHWPGLPQPLCWTGWSRHFHYEQAVSHDKRAVSAQCETSEKNDGRTGGGRVGGKLGELGGDEGNEGGSGRGGQGRTRTR